MGLDCYSRGPIVEALDLMETAGSLADRIRSWPVPDAIITKSVSRMQSRSVATRLLREVFEPNRARERHSLRPLLCQHLFS